jgi:hypothetical protein
MTTSKTHVVGSRPHSVPQNLRYARYVNMVSEETNPLSTTQTDPKLHILKRNPLQHRSGLARVMCFVLNGVVKDWTVPTHPETNMARSADAEGYIDPLG